MLKTISSSELRSQIKRVLNEVEYSSVHYVVQKFGQPAAAIVSIEDLNLLQKLREQQADTSLQQLVADVRTQSRQLDPGELDTLIEEARSEFYDLRSSQQTSRRASQPDAG